MTRTVKPEPAQIVHVEISERIERDLDNLVQTGLFGATREEAVRRILEAWLWANEDKLYRRA